jgi:hypothetical protein
MCVEGVIILQCGRPLKRRKVRKRKSCLARSRVLLRLFARILVKRQPVGTAVLLLEFYGGVAQAGRPRLYPDQPAGPRTIGIATPTPTRGSKPEMDGNQILEATRRNAAFRRLPIVVLTAIKGDPENCRKARRSHQTGHCRAASVRLRIRLHR